MIRNRNIPMPVRCMLWGRAAGRCEFMGCNRPVSWHPKTKETVNLADVSHIIGFSEDGPRGEDELSEELAKDIDNLMLVCRICHKNIDANRDNYTVDRLRQMKQAHESRIDVVSGIDRERSSHVLLYGANVGEHSSSLTFQKAAWAMLPDWYPAENLAISLGMVNSSFHDAEEDFWKIEKNQLQNLINQRVRPRLANGDISHLSIFGLAPQPLLMLLGFLLSDIPAAETYQFHREPPDWKWQDNSEGFEYVVQYPSEFRGDAALVLSLSATITDERVKAILGNSATVWRVTVSEPNNDFLKSKEQLRKFRETIRPLMDQIKAQHGEQAVVYVFPAVPVAIAVDFGRVIMPKADLPLRIYDENKSLGGFFHTLDLDAGLRLTGDTA